MFLLRHVRDKLFPKKKTKHSLEKILLPREVIVKNCFFLV